jgi:hypothetical protein
VSHFLSEDVAIQIAITPADGTASTDDALGAIVDMSGFDGVMAVVHMGTIASGAVTSLKWQQGEASNMSDAADLLASGQPIYDDDDNKVFYTDLLRPRERYVRLVIDRGSQNAVVASAVYFKYRARKRPVTHGSNVSGEQLLGIAEGSAVISSVSPSASVSPSSSTSPSSSASSSPSE